MKYESAAHVWLGLRGMYIRQGLVPAIQLLAFCVSDDKCRRWRSHCQVAEKYKLRVCDKHTFLITAAVVEMEELREMYGV